MRNCRLNDIHGPLVELLVPLAYACGKEVVLPAIQLLWVTLISRLMLTPLTGLLVVIILITLIVTTLITLMVLVTLETGIRAATSITQAMKTVAA